MDMQDFLFSIPLGKAVKNLLIERKLEDNTRLMNETKKKNLNLSYQKSPRSGQRETRTLTVITKNKTKTNESDLRCTSQRYRSRSIYKRMRPRNCKLINLTLSLFLSLMLSNPTIIQSPSKRECVALNNRYQPYKQEWRKKMYASCINGGFLGVSGKHS